MAQVNIVQPKIGSITVLSRTDTTVRVRWNPPAEGEGRFKGLKIYCEACGGTLVYLQDNPATFDIGDLQSDGHPGPFDISAVAEGSGDLYVYTDVEDGIGTTKAYPDGTRESDATDSFTAEMTVGSTLHFTIKAYPGPGWEFSKWTRNGNDTGYSRIQGIDFTKNTTNEYEIDYNAFFVRGTYTLTVRSYTDGRAHSTIRGGKVNGSTRSPNTIGSFEYEDSVTTLTAVPNQGYRFVRWEVDSGATSGEGPLVGSVHYGPTWSFRMPGANTRIYAVFESITGNLLYGELGNLLHGSSNKLIYDGD